MKCHVCGGEMQSVITDLPFKTDMRSILIIKSLPVLQCEHCREFLLEDAVMERVETILSNADTSAELEIIPYAA